MSLMGLIEKASTRGYDMIKFVTGQKTYNIEILAGKKRRYYVIDNLSIGSLK